jgi:hypothetical protein
MTPNVLVCAVALVIRCDRCCARAPVFAALAPTKDPGHVAILAADLDAPIPRWQLDERSRNRVHSSFRVHDVCTERSKRVQTCVISASLECTCLCSSLVSGSSKSLKSRDCRFSVGSDDGLEREFSFFKQLEVGVCTMRAPRDKRKSSNSQRKQVELNALRCSRRMCRALG